MRATSDLIDQYVTTLASVQTAGGLDRSQLLAALIVRDNLNQMESITSDEFVRLEETDEKLRALAQRILLELPRELWPEWRRTAGSRSESWWWNPETLAAAPSSGWWALATTAAVTSTLALLTTIVSRFFEGGPDTLGAFAIAIQGVLTIVAGAGAAELVSERVDELLARRGMPRVRLARARFLFALAVFGLVLGVRLSLPRIAVQYNNWGAYALQQKAYGEAIENCNRALSLQPGFPAAQYNLAEAYEQSLDYEKAIASYQAAIRSSPNLDLAYNNLARLQILAKQNYAGAQQLLASALALKPTDSQILASIYKNRGWANFGLKNYSQATADLLQALSVKPDRAAPHCLLAQVKQAQGSALGEVKRECEQCLRNNQTAVEPYWRDFASETLDKK